MTFELDEFGFPPNGVKTNKSGKGIANCTIKITRPCEELKAVFRYTLPRPQDVETPLLLLPQLFYPTT
jgi:hypothetical protein